MQIKFTILFMHKNQVWLIKMKDLQLITKNTVFYYMLILTRLNFNTLNLIFSRLS